jgi:hypothetical protein
VCWRLHGDLQTWVDCYEPCPAFVVNHLGNTAGINSQASFLPFMSIP